MKIGIILIIIGIALVVYLAKIKIEKRFLSNIGIVFGILLLLYGLVLAIQPNEFIVYTKTTISEESQ